MKKYHLKRTRRLPVQPQKCATCPFDPSGKYACLAPSLALSAVAEASRICHSTGSSNAINRRTGKLPKLCRGARDVQIKYFHAIGFLKEPTDAAWETKCQEMNIP